MEEKNEIPENVDSRLSYLLSVYSDNRSEIEQRITQRDNFAIQFIVSSGAVITLSLLSFDYAYYLIFLWPLVTLFFAIQIKYSYVIHNRIHLFLVNNLEPEIARLLKYSKNEKNNLCWENYCDHMSLKRNMKTPGIREGFFNISLFIIPVMTLAIFLGLHFAKVKEEFRDVFFWVMFSISIVFTLLIVIFGVYLLIRFKKLAKKEKEIVKE